MKKFFLLLFFLFPFFVFCESVTVTIVTQANTRVYGPTISSVPCTISVNFPSGNYSYIDAGLSSIFNTATFSGPYTVTDPDVPNNETYRLNTYCDVGGLSVVFTLTYGSDTSPHQSQYGHELNACPKGCGVCLTCTPGHAVWDSQLERLVYGCETLPGGGSNAPWARESSLQSLISGFSTFGNTWGQWAQSLSGKVNSANTHLDNIHDQLGRTTEAVVDRIERVEDRISASNDHLNDLKGKADTANGHLNDLKGKADTANGHLNDLKGQADTANGHLTGLNQKAEITNQNVSDTRNFTEEIKNSLNPNVTAPTMETPLDDITPNTSIILTLKNKLLPRYSFFTNSGGSQFPEWSFTLPLQSFGWRDFMIVFGGAAWSTVGGGILLTLMQFVRTLSKFVFYFIFLRCIILYLRQW